MQKNGKTGKRWLYRVCGAAGIACLLALLAPAFREAAEYREFFDAPAAEILAEHRGEFTMWNALHQTGHSPDGALDGASRHVSGLNGCYGIASLEAGQGAALEWTGKPRIGQARLFIENTGTGEILEPAFEKGEHSLPLAEGEYCLYFVGRHFYGGVEISGTGIGLEAE